MSSDQLDTDQLYEIINSKIETVKSIKNTLSELTFKLNGEKIQLNKFIVQYLKETQFFDYFNSSELIVDNHSKVKLHQDGIDKNEFISFIQDLFDIYNDDILLDGIGCLHLDYNPKYNSDIEGSHYELMLEFINPTIAKQFIKDNNLQTSKSYIKERIEQLNKSYESQINSLQGLIND